MTVSDLTDVALGMLVGIFALWLGGEKLLALYRARKQRQAMNRMFQLPTRKTRDELFR